ncbi:hypothetical protein [Paludisphaera mucosa]|uniref:Uncharacterized protein n=1 Tax=Paludisphaera mucosa TaxID=3030827 RepID=A0ABT6FAP9_9BACT|nr:hypothetical protein [Paludisphaera mucosa]MDG3004668.1 hypothetical protein [Paludisphaera mucosa]
MNPDLPPRPRKARRTLRPSRRVLRAAVAAVVLAGVLQYLTATVGVGAVRASLAGEYGPGKTVYAVDCRAIAPGLIVCSYSTRTNPSPGPKACSWAWEARYAWYGLGWRRLDLQMTAVS